MSVQGRASLALVFGSQPYKDWAASHPTDANKVALEYQGNRRPSAASNYARGLVGLCRENPPAEPPLPPPALGLFNTRFGYVRDDQSGSETEKLTALKAAGYGGVALNVIDHPASQWGGWRNLAAARGLWTIPWGRCSTLDQARMIRGIAEQWGSPGLILNLEQQGSDPQWLMTGPQVAAELVGYAGKVGVSTEPWMPENFNWLPLILFGAVVLPQSCVNEAPQFTPKTVVDRAKVFGWTLISPSFATYDTPSMVPERTDYVWPAPFGIYTVDDLAPEEIPLWV